MSWINLFKKNERLDTANATAWINLFKKIEKLDTANATDINQNKTLKFATDAEKDDFSIVLEAVKKRGSDLQYASDRLKNDPEIVWQAINKDSYSIEYAGKELVKNKEFVLRVIDYFEKSITENLNNYIAKEKLRNGYKGTNVSENEFNHFYKSYVLKTHNYRILEFIDRNLFNDLLNDKKTILKLIKNNLLGYYNIQELLKNKELMSDYDIVLALIELDSHNLKSLDKEHKYDKKIFITALKNWNYCLMEDNYNYFYLNCNNYNYFYLNCKDIPENLKDDEEVAIALIYQNIDNYDFISDRLKKIFAPIVLDKKLNSKHKNCRN